MKIEDRPGLPPTTPKPTKEKEQFANIEDLVPSDPHYHFGENTGFEKSAPKKAPPRPPESPPAAKETRKAAAPAAAKTRAKPEANAAKVVNQATSKATSQATGGDGTAMKVWKAFAKIMERPYAAIDNIIFGSVDALVGVFKNLVEVPTTFVGGIKKLLKGEIKDGFKDMGLAIVKIFQTPLDATLLVGGKLISSIQTLLGVEKAGRRLTGEEITELKQVYGDTIDYSKVVVKEGNAGPFTLPNRAFVLGNTIYIPPSLKGQRDVLVHEMGHVWQHQNGGTDYISESLWSQYFGDEYKWKKGVAQGKSFRELNPEQQAQLIQDAWNAGFFNNPGQRFIVGSTDYTDYLNDALEQIRAGKGAT